MKKIAFLLLAILLPMVAGAESVEIDGIYYNLIEKAKSAEVTNNPYGGYSGNIKIPDEVVYGDISYAITGISSNAFNNCSDLTSITIPCNITSIGTSAFYGCNSLTAVFISDLEAWCKILFKNSHSNPLHYSHHIIFNNKELTNLVIPNNLERIGDYAFSGCKNISSVTIPNSVGIIGKNAFDGCSGLSSVHISDLAKWCNIEFQNDKSNPLGYAHHLIINGEELNNVVIPSSVTSISNYTFCGASSLTSVNISSSVTSIGGFAFNGCRSLNTINIPNSVTSIGSSAFQYCTSLTSLVIPNSVTTIGSYALYGCSNLASVTISNNVTVIEKYTFHMCTNLAEIIIPNKVKKIEDKAFYYCSKLTSLTIPEEVTWIGNYAFLGCSSLMSIKLGKNVGSIGSRSFSQCSNLMEVIFNSTKVPQMGEIAGSAIVFTTDAFKDSYIQYATLYVPESAIEEFRDKAPWKWFKEIKALENYQSEEPMANKCVSPTISFIEGKLVFDSETEGAEFVSEINCSDIKRHYDKVITLAPIYKITVYATKTGLDDSDVATATIGWRNGTPILEGFNSITLGGTESNGDVNGDGTIDVADIATIISLMAGNKSK